MHKRRTWKRQCDPTRLELTDNTHQSRCCGLQDCFEPFFISTPMLCSSGALVMQDWLTTSQLISWLTGTNEKIFRISSEQLVSFSNHLKCYILESWIVGCKSEALPSMTSRAHKGRSIQTRRFICPKQISYNWGWKTQNSADLHHLCWHGTAQTIQNHM